MPYLLSLEDFFQHSYKENNEMIMKNYMAHNRKKKKNTNNIQGYNLQADSLLQL